MKNPKFVMVVINDAHCRVHQHIKVFDGVLQQNFHVPNGCYPRLQWFSSSTLSAHLFHHILQPNQATKLIQHLRRDGIGYGPYVAVRI